MKPAVLSAALLALTALAASQKPVEATQVAPKAPPTPVAKPLLKDGLPAPDFKTYTADGKEVTLKQLRGKIVILDFWATWCGPCQISMPGLEKIYGQIKDKDVVVLSVNTWDEKPEFVKWVAQNSGSKYHFNFVRDPAEGDHDAIRKASIARKLYNAPGIPTMYVIDRKGKIAGSFVGSGNEAELVKLLKKQGLQATAPKETN